MISAEAVEIERIRQTITRYTIAGDDKTPEVFTALSRKMQFSSSRPFLRYPDSVSRDARQSIPPRDGSV